MQTTKYILKMYERKLLAILMKQRILKLRLEQELSKNWSYIR